MTQDKTLRELFERSFNSKHGSGFHALAGDGKKSHNCEICAEDRQLNPKGYYLTFLSKNKCYWTEEMMNDIADFYEDKIKSVVRELQVDLPAKKYKDENGEYTIVSEYNQFGDDLLERLGIK